MHWLIAHWPLYIVAGVLTLAEWRLRPTKSDWKINLQAWLIFMLVGVVVLPLLPAITGKALLHGGQMPFWLGLLLFTVVMDLGEFLYHRAQHKVPFLWSMHSLHHSDPEMSALTTQRHFWGDQLLKALTIWPLAGWIIAPTPAVLASFSMISLWNFFVHARLNVNFGTWSWLLNSPAYHRRHHSSLPEHYNSNYAALFPIFDVLTGSYRRPDGFPPTGLDQRPLSLRDVAVWPLRYPPRKIDEAALTAG